MVYIRTENFFYHRTQGMGRGKTLTFQGPLTFATLRCMIIFDRVLLDDIQKLINYHEQNAKEIIAVKEYLYVIEHP